MTGTAQAQDIVLRLDGITKRFGSTLANDAVSLTLARGQVLALLGENGAGKTTLMNILFGQYLADAGTISVMGGPVIAGTLSDAASWPPFFWSRDGGDLRIAHFLGTHAMQALPAFALLAAPGAVGVSVAALGWLGITVAAYGLALAGVSFMP